jgi:hypothetical protein
MIADMNTKTFPQSLARMLLAGLGLAVVVSVLIALFGLVAGWRAPVMYSNGMFVVGSAVIIFGLLAVWGGFTSRGSFALTYAQSVSDMSLSERTKLWMLDALRGYNVVATCTICGVLMIGFSILIYELFS